LRSQISAASDNIYSSKYNKTSTYIPNSLSIYGQGTTGNPSLDLKARLLELELEKDESQKALELLKQLRD
jgi:hypothetical protein